jgi:diketogulonate reductase-like aldo/keto reductase
MMLRLLFISPALFALAMDIPTKEIASGVRMPVLSIGTGGLERSAAQQIVTAWLGLGGRGIDTASMYKNQGVVKDVIASSGVKREDVFITTKIPGCTNAKQNIDSDLKQLGTDYVDLLLIHFPSGDCVSAWKTLEDYYKKGKAKAIGVSNFKKHNLQPILEVASVVPHVNQIEHNVLENDAETVASAGANNITIEAFSPLGRSGQSGDISGNSVIKSVAANHKVSTYQVALKWIVQHGHVLTFQSSSQTHQQEDADIFSFTLTEKEMSTLDKLSTVNRSVPLLV